MLLKSRYYLLSVVFFVVHASHVFCQTNKILLQGQITQINNAEVIPGTTLIINPGNIITTTDADGAFKILLEKLNYNLEVRSVGFKPLKRTIDLTKHEYDVYTLNFQLETDEQMLGPIVVTAAKFEQNLQEVVVSMEIIKPKFIEHSNQTTMETAVEQVPGVTVIDGQANIRGGSGFSYGAGTRVLVLVDDLPVLAGDANDVKWSFIPIENVEQVEVIKGASSALYGSSALNGVINMRTAFPKDKPETKISFFTGIYDNPSDINKKWWGDETQTTSGASLSHRQKIKQLDFVIGGQYFNDEGFRKGEVEERFRVNLNVRYRSKKINGLSAGIAFGTQKTNGGTFLLWQNETTGAYIPQGDGDTALTTLSTYTSYRTSIDPYITYITNKSSHRLRTRYFYTKNVNNTDQGATSGVYYGEYLYQHHFGTALTLSAGISASHTDVTGELYQDSLNSIGKNTGNSFAYYFQYDWTIGKLNMNIGFRKEGGEISKQKFDPEQLFRMGASYPIAKYTFIRGYYGQGFRFPSIAEKYIRTQVGSIVIYPNDSLQTETGWSAEIGIKQGIKIADWKGLIDVSRFWTQYQDMMEFTFGLYGNPLVDPLFGLGFQSQNIGNTQITGYEISISGEGNIGKVNTTIMAGYTYIDPISLDFNPAVDTLINTSNKNILKYRYQHMFKSDIECGYKKFSVGFSTRYYSFMENIDQIFENTIEGVKEYREVHNTGDWVFDARFGYEIIKTIRLDLNIKNFTNHEYMGRPADLQAPRSYSLQASLKF
jgi:outer membrane cobalamin receptor